MSVIAKDPLVVFLTLGDVSAISYASAHRDRISGLIDHCFNHRNDIMVVKSDQQLAIDSRIPVVTVSQVVSEFDRKKLYLLLSLQFSRFFSRYYQRCFASLVSEISKLSGGTKPIRLIACELIDIVAGYYLKSQGLIDELYIDLHGLAREEFVVAAEHEPRVLRKVYLLFKAQRATQLYKKIFAATDCYISASTLLIQHLEAYYGAKSPSLILPFCLSHAKKNTGLPVSVALVNKLDQIDKKGKKIISFLGSFKYFSGVDFLLDAYAALCHLRDDVHLFIAGQGQLLGLVNSKLARLPVDSYTYFSSIPYSDVDAVYSRSAVIVNPEKFNHFSDNISHLKFFEAMYSGRPIVAPRFQIHQHGINNGIHCQLYDPDDIQSMISVIQGVLDNVDQLAALASGNRSLVETQFVYERRFTTAVASQLLS